MNFMLLASHEPNGFRVVAQLLILFFELWTYGCGANANITMHRGDVSTTCRTVSQCLQAYITKHNASITLSVPILTKGEIAFS